MELKELFQEWNISLVLMAWGLSFIIGVIIVQVWKSGMNTVRPKDQAAAYIVSDSLMFRQKSDRFLYSTVNKTRRQDSASPSAAGNLSRTIARRR